MKLFKLNILLLMLSLSACDYPKDRYGYENVFEPITDIETAAGDIVEADPYGSEARKIAQENYLKKLGSDDYITQRQNWNQKLESRKQQFNDTLKREYLELSNKLLKENNHTDSTYFRRKALKAEKADFDVMPEDPSRWIVENDEEMEDLRAARLALLDSLVGFSPAVSPLDASRSIVYYDCWVQQAQVKSLKLKQDNCKKQYQAQYAKLEDIASDIGDKSVVELNQQYKWVDVDSSVYKNILDPEAEQTTEVRDLYKIEYTSPKVTAIKQQQQKAASNKTASLSTSKINQMNKAVATDAKPSLAYTPATKAAASSASQVGAKPTAAVSAPAAPVVGPLPAGVKAAEDKSLISDQTDNRSPELVYMAYFDGKSDQLSEAAKAELDKAVEDIKKNSPKMVSINGHTDRSFDSGESLIASKKRADAARDYLISKGVAREMIRTYGFGKTDNIVDNTEGQPVPANNRAEIVFKGSASQ